MKKNIKIVAMSIFSIWSLGASSQNAKTASSLFKCGDFVGSKLAPAALGLMTLFFGLGQVLGPLIAGRLAFYTSSYSIAFVVAGIAAFLGAFSSIVLKDKKEAGS